MLGPTLETDRLILRPPIDEDLDGWEAFGAEPETMRFMGGVQSRAALWRAHSMVAGSWALHGFGMFAVIEKGTGCWVGRLGPWRLEGWPGTEIGWGLLRSAWGKGYASEGAAAVMHWVVDRLGWTDIIHALRILPFSIALLFVVSNAQAQTIRAPHCVPRKVSIIKSPGVRVSEDAQRQRHAQMKVELDQDAEYPLRPGMGL